MCIKLCKLELVRKGMTANGILVNENPAKEVEIFRRFQAGPNGGHQNVVRLLECWADEAYSFIVLEFMPHGEFLDLIIACGRLKEEATHRFLGQLVQGVQALHRAGVCHLDLSPENMLLSEDYSVKVCDFGVARDLLPDGMAFPAEKNKPGKIKYMAPEIYYGLGFEGCAADVYSMGVILFIMVTGTHPYKIPVAADKEFVCVYSGQVSVVLERMKIDVNPSLVNLITQLICPAQKRLTTDQILNHPWMMKE